jgi:hypothetical protein
MHGGHGTHLVLKELPTLLVLAQQLLGISPKQKLAPLRPGRAKKPITNHISGYGQWHAYLP